MSRKVICTFVGERKTLGQAIDRSDIEEQIDGLRRSAKKIRENLDCDHLVYAVKTFGKDGDYYKVRFCMEPMSDYNFGVWLVQHPTCTVYAVHRNGDFNLSVK